VHVVVNHLRLRDPLTDETASAFDEGVRIAVEAGALSAQVAKVDDRHLILLLGFASAEDADRVAREVGGTWMREHVSRLLAGGTERSVGVIIASA
jgi:hypothetical protein